MDFSTSKALGEIWSNNDLRGGIPEWIMFLVIALTLSVIWFCVFAVYHMIKAFLRFVVSMMTVSSSKEDSLVVTNAAKASVTQITPQPMASAPVMSSLVLPEVSWKAEERKIRAGVLRVRQIGDRRFNCYIWSKQKSKHLGVCHASSLAEALDWAEDKVVNKSKSRPAKKVAELPISASAETESVTMANPCSMEESLAESYAPEFVTSPIPFDENEYAAVMAEVQQQDCASQQPIVEPAKKSIPRKPSTSAVMSYSGVLISAGWKQYPGFAGGKPYKSFAVELADDALGGGSNEIRGNDLERAVELAGVVPGDRIKLSQTGETPVPIREKSKDGVSETKTKKKKVFEIFKI